VIPNTIRLVFAGFSFAISYATAGLVTWILTITIPLGLAGVQALVVRAVARRPHRNT
jgi:uncharacterized membrane protein YccF (DUF307 family)